MILIIGGDSQIGYSFYNYIKKKDLNVIKTTRNLNRINKDTIYFNLENPKFEKNFLSNISSAYIFAGISKIKYCENHKKISYLVNFINTRKTIKILLKNNIKTFFASTSKVFGINSKFPHENSKKNPQNYYAYLKLKIEQEFYNNQLFVVLRLGKVLQNNFIKTILNKNLVEKNEYKISKDFYISPIYINNLCYLMIKLHFYKNINGIFNICSEDSLNYYELYQYLKDKYMFKKNIFLKRNVYKNKNVFMELMNTNKIKKIGFRIFKTKTHLKKIIK